MASASAGSRNAGLSSALTALAEYEREVDGILADLESQIAERELEYLSSTLGSGNAITGWENTGDSRPTLGSRGGTTGGVPDADRVFSLSSVTGAAAIGSMDQSLGMFGLGMLQHQSSYGAFSEFGRQVSDDAFDPLQAAAAAATAEGLTGNLEFATTRSQYSGAGGGGASSVGRKRPRPEQEEEEEEAEQQEEEEEEEEEEDARTAGDETQDAGGVDDSASMASTGQGTASNRRSGRARRPRKPRGADD
jgi:hypothetical protein